MKNTTKLSGEYRDFILRRMTWHGSVKRADLVELLSVSTATASNLLSAFTKENANVVCHERASYQFVYGYIPDKVSADHFLAALLYAGHAGEDPNFHAGETPPYEVVPGIRHHVDEHILQRILAALREEHALEVTYVNMKPGEGAKRRIIEPMCLIYIHGRWHLKAFCRTANPPGTRDFVLSRFKAIHGVYDMIFARHRMPNFGEKMVSKRFVPHPLLDSDQQEILDFGQN
ncbi:MAG: WYL domain-containing protein [Gammaproteobacteria bacterium]|nr:WYL domain-containing protein [Gammaproteobacteria bacterium]